MVTPSVFFVKFKSRLANSLCELHALKDFNDREGIKAILWIIFFEFTGDENIHLIDFSRHLANQFYHTPLSKKTRTAAICEYTKIDQMRKKVFGLVWFGFIPHRFAPLVD